MIGRERGEILLGHVEITQPNIGLIWTATCSDQGTKDRKAHAMESRH